MKVFVRGTFFSFSLPKGHGHTSSFCSVSTCGVEGHAGKDSEVGTGRSQDARAVRFSIKSPAVDSDLGAGRSGSPYTFRWRHR